MMRSHFRHAAVALLLVAGTATAGAQTYYREVADIIEPLQLSAAQRTTIYRTIVPQRRGPVVRERIVTEPVAPAPVYRERVPVYRERVVTPIDEYAYDYPDNGYDYRYDNSYGYDYRGDYAYAVGTRVPATVRLAPLPPALVAEVPTVRPYRYMIYNSRVLLIDPATSTVVADVTGY
jgi:hypothetical protein